MWKVATQPGGDDNSDDEMRARLIPELISGRTAFSFATTEPDSSANELQQWIVARQLIGRDITG